MLRLVKAFLDIALWRRTPAELPASVFLLALAAIAASLTEVLGALLPPPPNGQIATRIALEVAMPVLFIWVLLALKQRKERFLQTASAYLGVGVLAALILYPLESVMQLMGQQNAAVLPVGVMYMAVLIGYLLACAHIWRSALDTGLVIGLVVSFGYFMAKLIIEQQVLQPS
jgi:hypothetical protein